MLSSFFIGLVLENFVLQPGVHLFAYGASALLTYTAFFLHPGSFFLLVPLHFLAFTGASSRLGHYGRDRSLRGLLIGSCTIVSLLALGFPLLVRMVEAFARRKSDNGEGNGISGGFSDFEQYAIGESSPFSRKCQC